MRKRPGMYIGSTGVTRSAPPRLRGCGQLGGRGAGRPLRHGLGDDPPGQLRHGHRQRPRHPGREDGEGGQVRPRGRAHRPARRRQVRRGRRLQGLRRSARRRRLGRQRALGRADGRSSSATASRGRSPTSAAPRRARCVQGEPTDETGTTITFRPDDEVFETLDFEYGTLEQRLRETAFLTRGLRITITDERGEGDEGTASSTTRAASRTSSATSTRTRTRSSRRSSSSRARTTRAPSRSRCSGTAPTRSRCSRSPTTSTRTRAARTSPASAPR